MTSEIKYHDYLFLSDTTPSKFKLAGECPDKGTIEGRELKNKTMAKNDKIYKLANCKMANGLAFCSHVLRRYTRKDRRQPVLYTNCLLRCFVHSVAVCLKNSLMITSLTFDGIPLAPKYLSKDPCRRLDK